MQRLISGTARHTCQLLRRSLRVSRASPLPGRLLSYLIRQTCVQAEQTKYIQQRGLLSLGVRRYLSNTAVVHAPEQDPDCHTAYSNTRLAFAGVSSSLVTHLARASSRDLVACSSLQQTAAVQVSSK